MILTVNKTEADLFENTEISSQINSPLTNFKLTGDKSYSYNIPSSENNLSAIYFSNHPQAENEKKAIETTLYDASIVIIEGSANIKRTTEKAITLDCTVPPANISAKFWNKKLREIDLGSDTLTTKAEKSRINVLNFDDLFYKVSNASDERQFQELFLVEKSIFRVKHYNSVFFEYTFEPNGSTKENYKSNALADFSYAVMKYNTSKVIASIELFFINNTFSVVFSEDTLITFEIYFPKKQPIFTNETFLFLNPKQLTYESIGYDLALKRLVNKPYIFPTIYAPKFYNDKTSDFNSFINYKENGELKLNDDLNRTTFPLVPCFTFRFIFERLMELMNYKMQVSFWDNWNDLAFCAMKDFSKQHEGTSLPFNTYGNTIKYADYMPDWTVLEFFNEFGYLTGAGFDFNQTEKEVRIKQYEDVLTETPVIFEGIYKVIDTSFEQENPYQLSYTGTIDSEITTDEQKTYFADYPITTEERNKIPFKFVPMGVQNTLSRGGQTKEDVKVLCHSTGESVMFDLSKERPTPRIFFYDSINRIALYENNKYSLSRTGDKSITKFWKNIIGYRKGKIVTIEMPISTQKFSQIGLMKAFQVDNVNYLIKQIAIKVKKSRRLHNATLTLEQIS